LAGVLTKTAKKNEKVWNRHFPLLKITGKREFLVQQDRGGGEESDERERERRTTKKQEQSPRSIKDKDNRGSLGGVHRL